MDLARREQRERVLRAIGMALLLVAAAGPAAAEERELGRFGARLEAGGTLGMGDVGLGGIASRASVSWRPLVLEWSGDFCGYLDGGPRSNELTLLGGVGASFPVTARWRGAALLVGGLHAITIDEPGGIGYHDHALPAAGLRVGVTGTPARPRLFFPSITLAATLVADLEREYDVFLREDVGGYTALFSVTIGVGLAPGP
jgi:hypothetical protein